MTLLEIVMIGAGLAMDALAVSVCKGLAMKRRDWRAAALIAAWFGFFQFIMPLFGCLLGSAFSGIAGALGSWIAFVLLALIGANMIRESFSDEENNQNASTAPKVMLPLAVATSIDALSVGITFAFFEINVWLASGLIGVITFVICVFGVRIGSRFGEKLGRRAEILGGAVLIIIGLKILLEHLGILA